MEKFENFVDILHFIGGGVIRTRSALKTLICTFFDTFLLQPKKKINTENTLFIATMYKKFFCGRHSETVKQKKTNDNFCKKHFNDIILKY